MPAPNKQHYYYRKQYRYRSQNEHHS
ncbi:uncharacterized protein METZ01_LOCUS308167, partial [marine metagenome]